MSDRFHRGFGRGLLALLAAALALGAAAPAAAAADKEKDKPPAKLLGDPLDHPGWVRGAAFSPDGNRVVTGCSDGKARIWEVSSGKLLATLELKNPVWSVAYSPGGDSILVGSGENQEKDKDPVGEAVLWDAATFKKIGKPLPTQGPIFSVGYADDGKKLVLLTVCTDGTVQRWNALTTSPLGDPLTFKKSIWCGAQSPDGKTVIVAPLGPVAHVWLPSGAKPDGTELKHDYEVQGVAFSTDGKYFATAAGHDKTTGGKKLGGEVRVWETATGKEVGDPIRQDKLMHEVAMSPNGDKVLSGGENNAVEMWDVNTGDRLGAPMKSPGGILTLAISPDGKYLLIGGKDKDKDKGTAQLWEFARPLK